MNSAPWQWPAIVGHSTLLNETFRRWTGRPLATDAVTGEALAKLLYEAPFVLVSHGTEADPLFNYANRSAQQLWELDWDGFVGMPSRRSAEVEARSDRSMALREALGKGWVQGYSGVRISANGRRFRIFDGLIWNLLDADDRLCGQAATFDRWEYL